VPDEAAAVEQFAGPAAVCVRVGCCPSRPGTCRSTERCGRAESAGPHTRSCAFVVLITHGFPSSVADFLQLIGPLVKPAAGQDFRVVALSLPGYAFSTPLTATGGRWAAPKRAWVELMRRLGYERYGVQGDVGAGVSGAVAAPTASM
jgi:pimeloyl-ACP methyl ester carboxylesterase